MLNIGQVVYDYTNNRVIVFAGFEMLQDTKTGKCHTISAFILKDGTFIRSEKFNDFKYSSLYMDGKPIIGSLIDKCSCHGCYFGIIDGDKSEIKIWAKRAIEKMETLINKHGLNVTEKTFDNRKYPHYCIGD